MMGGSIFCDFFDSQTEFISKAARDWKDHHDPGMLDESWKVSHRDAMLARDIEDLVQICRVVACGIEAHWASLHKNIIDNKSVDYRAWEKRFDFSFGAAARAFDAVKACIALARRNGYAIVNEGDFEEAERSLKATRETFLGCWPRADEGIIHESQEQYRAGRYGTLDDFMNELQHNPSEVD
jgi:hypothetical protein